MNGSLSIVFGPAPKGTIVIGGPDTSDPDSMPASDDLPDGKPAIQLNIDVPLGKRGKSRKV